MIVDLPDTTTNDINKRITTLREEGGAITLGRVLTLVAAPDCEEIVEDVDRRRRVGEPRAPVPDHRGRAPGTGAPRARG